MDFTLPKDRGHRTRTRLIAFAAAVAVLWPCWRRISSRLGDFYDYSGSIVSAQHILRGLRPYRDIQTPMQTLTFLYNAGCEWLLGPSYAALAWGNFTLALVLFAAVLLLLDGPLPLAGAFLIALCLPLAAVLQHGVPTHNGLAFTILAVQSLLAARAVKEGRLGSGRLAALLLLATLSGMAKLNFHLVGTGTAALGIFLALRTHGTTSRALTAAVGYVAFSVVAGPLVEIAWTGVSPQTWWFNVIATPIERHDGLRQLLSSQFWFGIINDNYPKVFIGGIAFVAALLFALGGIICFFAAPEGWRPPAIVRRLTPIFVSAWFLFGGCLFIATNSETLILNAAYFVVGLVCLGLIYGERIGAWARYYFQGAALSLALVLLVAAVIALRNFSRLNYGREDLAAHWIPAGKIDPSAEKFFGRLRFSPRSAALLSEVFSVVDRYDLRANSQLVYWGPSLELMNQLNGPSQVPGLPLAWARNVFVRDNDSPRIIETLRAAPYQWIILTQMWSIHVPPRVLAYIQTAYEVERSDQYIIVFHRRPEPASP
ncbi:MAG: hypothetical protein QOD12_1731 [Verrucomicrobiota bacterium]